MEYHYWHVSNIGTSPLDRRVHKKYLITLCGRVAKLSEAI